MENAKEGLKWMATQSFVTEIWDHDQWKTNRNHITREISHFHVVCTQRLVKQTQVLTSKTNNNNNKSPKP